MYHMVQRVDVTVRSAAAPSEVYAYVRDGATWPSWTSLESFELEKGPEDVGGVRVFRRKNVVSREEIVELVPDKRLSYVLLSGLPLKGYRGFVDLEPDGGGTRIHWYSSFEPKVPGTGWLYRIALQKIIQSFATGLAAVAEGAA